MSLCVFFLLSPLSRLSSVSVVFDFSDSLNDVAPLSPILLPFYAKRKEKSDLLIDVFLCVFLLLYSHLKSRFVSVVFDLNDSLNDVAPLSPILLPVCEEERKRVNC